MKLFVASAMLYLGVAGWPGIVNADPTPVDFTAADCGFTAGSINKQNQWMVYVQPTYSGDFIFTPGAGISLKQSAKGAGYAYAFLSDKENPASRDDLSSGMSQTLGIQFVLTDSGTPFTGKGTILSLGWALYIPAGSENVPFRVKIQRTAADTYELAFVNTAKGTVTGAAPLPIPAADLGFNAAEKKNTSDALQLSFMLSNEGGKEESSWRVSGVLVNLATQKKFTLEGTVSDATGFYKKRDLIRTFVNERIAAASDGLTSVVITKFDPEPVQ